MRSMNGMFRKLFCGLCCVLWLCGGANHADASAMYGCKFEAVVVQIHGKLKRVEADSASHALDVSLKLKRVLDVINHRPKRCQAMLSKTFRAPALLFQAPLHAKLLVVGGTARIEFKHVSPMIEKEFQTWSFVMQPGTPHEKITGRKRLSPKFAKKAVTRKMALRWLQSLRSKDGKYYVYRVKRSGKKGGFRLKCKGGKSCDPKKCTLVSESGSFLLGVKLSGAVFKASVGANLKPMTLEISHTPMAPYWNYKGWSIGPSGAELGIEINTPQVPYVKLFRDRIEGAFYMKFDSFSGQLLEDPFCLDSPDDPEVNSQPACSFRLPKKRTFKIVFDFGISPDAMRCMRFPKAKAK